MTQSLVSGNVLVQKVWVPLPPISFFASSPTSDLSAWVTAWATVVLTIATVALAYLTWQLAQATRSPAVVATIEPNGWAPTMLLDIHLSNEGSASAYDVTVTFDPPIPRKHENQVHLDRASVLRSGQRIVSTLAEATQMIDAVYEVTVSWTKRPKGRKIKSVYPIDVSALKGLRLVNGGDPLFRIADDIKKLREQIDRIASGSNRIEVDSYTSVDREAERRALEERFRAPETDNETITSPISTSSMGRDTPRINQAIHKLRQFLQALTMP